VTNHNIVSFQAIHAGWKAGIIQIVMESRRLHNIHPGIHKNETRNQQKKSTPIWTEKIIFSGTCHFLGVSSKITLKEGVITSSCGKMHHLWAYICLSGHILDAPRIIGITCLHP